MFEIKAEDSGLIKTIQQIIQQTGHPIGLMAGIASELLSVTEANFAAEGRPAWMGLKYPRAKGTSSDKLLQMTGQLAASIQSFYDAESAGVGSNKVYAAIHQLGGQTRPHEIRPKNGRALAFNGRVVKKVNHPGSKIPARPFLPITASGELQPEATEAVLATAQDFLRTVGD